MIPRQKWASLCWFVVITMLVVLCGSCGSSSHNLSPAQAQAVSQQIMMSVETALAQSFSAGPAAPRAAHPTLPAVVRDIHPDQSSGCVINPTSENCNIPVTYSGPCPGGGTISVSGDFIYTLDSSGDGSHSSTLTITPTNCSVSNLTINGDPNVTVGTQLNFQANAPAYPWTFTEGGGISYGPDPSGSCTLNVTLKVTSAATCTITGTVCGRSMNGSC